MMSPENTCQEQASSSARRPFLLFHHRTILAVVVALSLPLTLRAEDPTASGEELVKTNCLQCHRADNPKYPDHNLGWVFHKRYDRAGWVDNIQRMEAIATKDEYISEPWSEADKAAMADYLTQETTVVWNDRERIGMGHYSVVHFPVAFLFVALLFELASMLAGWPMRRDFLNVVVWLAALSATLAVALGVILTWEVSALSEDLGDHQVAGFATLGFAWACVLFREIAISRGSTGAKWLYRILLVLAVVSVAAAGHLGGKLSHGEYLPDWLLSILN